MNIYPAVFYKERGKGYYVIFPNFEGATGGETLEEAYRMANDFLGLKLYDYFIEGKIYPEAENIKSIKINDEDAVIEESFTSLVAVDMKEYVKNYEHRTVRKNVTIPSYLNEMAKNNNINVSAVLQKALIEELGLDE